MLRVVSGFSLPGAVFLTDGERAVLAHGQGVEVWKASRVGTDLPLLRGLAALWATLRDSWKAMGLLPETRGITPLEALLAALLTLLLLPVPLALGLVLPMRVADALLDRQTQPFLYYALFEALSLAGLLAYFRLLVLLPPFRSLLRYHGAEHMVVHLLERGLPLTLEEARRQSPYHPRCGTAFLGMSFLLAVLFYGLFLPLPEGNPLLFLGLKLGLLPLLVGVSYELFRLMPRVPALMALGLFLQRFTVERPGDEELEVALKAARELVGRGDLAHGPEPSS
ncbi:hypothetical protein TJA_20200 [Thermus sp. LT1-2-5]|uniref:DUF1385 domain-containing protein n=1 Tax=Thermus sp. LT1-2-5 TaxID=3026935 RepID=UPI0030EA829C